jgi:selenocysteine-specific elongation factor
MHVIGTAGHIDHGKSTLVAALTGIHPDRLKEEQEREMTIDLGFAWMSLPGGETVGIVDVPGHRDFIENMLAGVGGIDAALLVIAADEGVMPQTREHLAILDLLQIESGIIVLTKTDLTPDPEWLEMVKSDVRQVLQGTVLAGSPIVQVSARNGSGLDVLVNAINECLAQHPPRPDLGRPRLPVDRVFTITGFGTVVTGTLTDGQIKLGDEVELLPSGLRARVRGLQTHKKKEQTAVQGSRTAVNISGINLEDVRRGEVLAHVGKYNPSAMLDVHFHLLADATGPLRHSSEMKFFIGAAEVLARVRLLGVDELRPGEEGWLQLELRTPVVAVRGDRYILRRPSPSETMGGGAVMDPHPGKRHRRFDPALLERLESLKRGSPGELIAQSYLILGPAPIRDAVGRARLNPAQAEDGLANLLQNGQLLVLETGEVHPDADLLAITSTAWSTLSGMANRELDTYHASYPLRKGMPREELKSRLKLQSRLFIAAVRKWAEDQILVEKGTLIARRGHSAQFTPQQQGEVSRLMTLFDAAPYATPSVKECQNEVGDDVYQALLDLDRLVQVAPEVVFRREDFDALLRLVQEHFQREPTLTVSQLRDRVKSSRKYILGFLEYLDAIGLTFRDGDFRRLKH